MNPSQELFTEKELVMERYYNTARRSFMMPELASLTQRHLPPAFVAV
jgi:hypothetical protein